MQERLYKFDNLKGILIFLVVFAHFLAYVDGVKILRLTIYSFHMPMFLFISGYFASFDRKNIVFRLIYPYVIFQTLYLIFDIYYLKTDNLVLTFTRPRWILWYLFALIVYRLLIPFFDTPSPKKQFIIMICTTLTALLAGFDRKLGYDFSASRIICFMPFFLAGFYLRKYPPVPTPGKFKQYIFNLILFILLAAIMVKILEAGFISLKMFFGSYSYEAMQYNIKIRLLHFVFAGIWIAAGILLMPNRKIPLLSQAGRYSLPIYLLHGFAVRYIGRQFESLPFSYAFLLSLSLFILLGNKYSNRIFISQFKGKWIEKFI